MTHKEFYIWLDGFMTNRRWTSITQVDIETIQKKMKEVTSDTSTTSFRRFEPVPVPINPIPNNSDYPFRPPYEVYCGSKDL